ncbi:MAG: HEPN domain-containing protein, partial [Acidiferrobacterales bacterium]|nr:HEPN domain-containing protein [Acidiferrobacterales bacterium]
MSIKAVARARKYLQTAQRDIDHGDYESSVSRAYYAMFYVTRALLQQEQIEARTHSGIINQFGLH